MTTREIAVAFGMSVDQFARTIGYSRQALYQNEIRMTPRAENAIADLSELNHAMFKMETEEARRKFEAREKAVKEFEQRILCRGGSDD